MVKIKPPSRDLDKFIVRLPDGMRDKISKAADENKRTMNAEIVARLEESFEGQDNTGSPKSSWMKIVKESALASLDKRVERLEDEVTALKTRGEKE